MRAEIAHSTHFFRSLLEDFERNHIRKIIAQTKGIISGPNGAAVRLGINRATLYFRMRKLGISRESISSHAFSDSWTALLHRYSHVHRCRG